MGTGRLQHGVLGQSVLAMGHHMHQLLQKIARKTQHQGQAVSKVSIDTTAAGPLISLPWPPPRGRSLPRNGFRHITATCAELVGILHAAGSGVALDMDRACLCETMDVIGLFGFGQSFEAVTCAFFTKTLDLPGP